MSMIQQGRVGRPSGCGWAICGWTQCGEYGEVWGVYQNRRERAGKWHWYNGIFGKTKTCFMKPCWPANPQYAEQQAWRAVFAAAIAAWQALTEEQKQEYNNRMKKRNRTGYHFYISEYLKTH